MRFQCQPLCTACCDQQGFVWLTEEDILRIAAHLGLAPAVFEERYVYRAKRLRRLRVPRKAQCPFLFKKGDRGGCSIHTVKPVQCRTFPFWPELIGSRREWQKIAKYCPGIERGELINITLARESAAEMKAAHPNLYET